MIPLRLHPGSSRRSIWRQRGGNPEESTMNGKSLLLGVALGMFALAPAAAPAQSVGQDLKNAGHSTADASKKVADKTANGTKTAAKDTGHGTKVAANKTAQGTKTVAHKTTEGTKTVAHDTA